MPNDRVTIKKSDQLTLEQLDKQLRRKVEEGRGPYVELKTPIGKYGRVKIVFCQDKDPKTIGESKGAIRTLIDRLMLLPEQRAVVEHRLQKQDNNSEPMGADRLFRFISGDPQNEAEKAIADEVRTNGRLKEIIRDREELESMSDIGEMNQRYQALTNDNPGKISIFELSRETVQTLHLQGNVTVEQDATLDYRHALFDRKLCGEHLLAAAYGAQPFETEQGLKSVGVGDTATSNVAISCGMDPCFPVCVFYEDSEGVTPESTLTHVNSRYAFMRAGDYIQSQLGKNHTCDEIDRMEGEGKSPESVTIMVRPAIIDNSNNACFKKSIKTALFIDNYLQAFELQHKYRPHLNIIEQSVHRRQVWVIANANTKTISLGFLQMNF